MSEIEGERVLSDPLPICLAGKLLAVRPEDGMAIALSMSGGARRFVLVFSTPRLLVEMMERAGILVYEGATISSHRDFVESVWSQGYRIALDPRPDGEGATRWTEIYRGIGE